MRGQSQRRLQDRERIVTSGRCRVLAIIEQLQEDGRRPYAAIGKAVGLSEAAVRQRVQKLLDQGVMQIVAVTDPLTVGFRRQAMVGINVEETSIPSPKHCRPWPNASTW